MRIIAAAAALLAFNIAHAATFLNGEPTPLTVTFDGADIRVQTDGEVVVPPPVEPPPAPDSCPASGRVPVRASLDLRESQPQSYFRPQPWVAEKVVADAAGNIDVGNYGGTEQSKYVAVAKCPIPTNDHLVQGCVANVGSYGSLKYGGNNQCQLEAGATYYVLYGSDRCSTQNCTITRTYR